LKQNLSHNTRSYGNSFLISHIKWWKTCSGFWAKKQLYFEFGAENLMMSYWNNNSSILLSRFWILNSSRALPLSIWFEKRYLTIRHSKWLKCETMYFEKIPWNGFLVKRFPCYVVLPWYLQFTQLIPWVPRFLNGSMAKLWVDVQVCC
jgi:hypothetical protein